MPWLVCRVRGQLSGITSFLSPYGSQGWDSGHQAWWQASLPAEPSCQSPYFHKWYWPTFFRGVTFLYFDSIAMTWGFCLSNMLILKALITIYYLHRRISLRHSHDSYILYSHPVHPFYSSSPFSSSISGPIGSPFSFMTFFYNDFCFVFVFLIQSLTG